MMITGAASAGEPPFPPPISRAFIQFRPEQTNALEISLRVLADGADGPIVQPAVTVTMVCIERSRSCHETDDLTGAGQRLFFDPGGCERTRVAHVVPGGRDPAVGALDVRDPKLVDVAVEGIGDAAHVPADAVATELWRSFSPPPR